VKDSAGNLRPIEQAKLVEIMYGLAM